MRQVEENLGMNRWASNLRLLRLREIEILEEYLRDRRFRNCLELGAGSGIQSAELTRFCDRVVATDLDAERLFSSEARLDVERKIADAEDLLTVFEGQEFDLLFSSNVLEHLPNVSRFLDQSRFLLAPGGIAIHILPNPLWRLLSTCFFYPAKLYSLVDSVASASSGKRASKVKKLGNNIKKQVSRKSRWARFFPQPHGVSDSLVQEFLAFRKSVWIEAFESQGWSVVSILNGPISTGYGLGFNTVKAFMERAGLSTEYIFVLKLKL